MSMLVLSLVSVFEKLRDGNCRIICVRDWDQLPPVSNGWRGKEVDPLILKDSKLLKRWAENNLFVLTRCRRSDQAHFDFYTSLPDDLQSAIDLTKRRYKKRSKIDLHLVISHRHRRELNTKEQDLFCQVTVFYTHPTLPTNDAAFISVVALSCTKNYPIYLSIELPFTVYLLTSCS